MPHRNEFDYPSDMSRFPKSSQFILRLAHDLDWTIHWMGNNRTTAKIVSPGHEKSINIPSTNVKASRADSWLKVIHRYSDDERFREWVDDNSTTRKKGAQVLTSVGTDGEPSPLAVEAIQAGALAKTPLGETAIAKAMREAHEAAARKATEAAAEFRSASQAVTGGPAAAKAAGREFGEALGELAEPSATLIEKPWMVRRGGQAGGEGRMYESPSVIERIHVEGNIDYRCRHCPYENTNPRSVAVHSAKKHPEHQMGEQPEARKVHDYKPTDIKRPLSAVRRLATEITHVLDSMDDWASMDPQELARTLAEGVYDQHPDREPVAPLTSEQIISRIVGLVDRGRLADMHQKVEDMAAAMVEATDARSRLAGEVIEAQRIARECSARVEELLDERRALRELLAEPTEKEGKS